MDNNGLENQNSNLNNELENSTEQLLNQEVQSFFNEPQKSDDNVEMLNVSPKPDSVEPKITDINNVNNQSPINPANTYTDINPNNSYRDIFRADVKTNNVNTNNQTNEPVSIKENISSSSYKDNLVKYDDNTPVFGAKKNLKEIKMGPFNIPVSSYLFLLLSIAIYFLVAPFIESIFEARSLSQAIKLTFAVTSEGSGGVQELIFYGYQFFLLLTLLTSVILVGYAIVNLFQNGRLVQDFKEHIKGIVVGAACVAILSVLVLKVLDYDIVTKIVRIFTIDGFQLKIVPGGFVDFFYKL